MASELTDGLPTQENLRAAADSLVATWGLFDAPLLRGLGVAQFGLMYGMASRTHSAARSALLLLDQGLTLDALTLTRVAYENALTAYWALLMGQDGTHALANEAERQRAETKRVGDRAFPSSVHAGMPITIDELETSSRLSAKKVLDRCQDLQPGGDEAYFIYRYLSPNCHASLTSAERWLYVDPSDPDPDAPTLLEHPLIEEIDEWWVLYGLTMSMLWAGYAIDERMDGRPRRTQLKQIARDLRITLRLSLSGPASARKVKADAEQRRAKRSRPAASDA